MEPLFLPTLHTFENDNIFTGSWGELRFKVTPSITMKNPNDKHGIRFFTIRAKKFDKIVFISLLRIKKCHFIPVV